MYQIEGQLPITTADRLRRLQDEIYYQIAHSDHNHVEGTCDDPSRDEPWTASENSWLSCMVNRYPTGNWQIKMLDAYRHPEAELASISDNTPFQTVISGYEQTAHRYLLLQQKAMMTVAFKLGRKVKGQADKIGILETVPFYCCMFNLSADSQRRTTLNGSGLAKKAAEKYGGDKFPKDFVSLETRQYLTALHAGLERPIIASLRRNRPQGETWYMNYPEDRATDMFIDELQGLKIDGLIMGVDISDDEKVKSVAAISPFLQRLKDSRLLYSLHTGELKDEETAAGLENIISAIRLQNIRLGHAYSLFRLLSAQKDDPVLACQKERIAQIAVELGMSPDTSYFDIAIKILELAKEKNISLQLCLTSNAIICMNQPPSDYLRHPFILSLKRYGPALIPYLPRLTFSADNYTITGFTVQDQLCGLIKELLINSSDRWGPHNLADFFKQVTLP